MRHNLEMQSAVTSPLQGDFIAFYLLFNSYRRSASFNSTYSLFLEYLNFQTSAVAEGQDHN